MSKSEWNTNEILKAFKSQTFWNKLTLGAIRIIQKRTREGRDIYGKPFQPYTDKYIERKRKSGYAAPENVNLILSRVGGMMASIDHEVKSGLDGALVLFNDRVKEQLAYYHNISGVAKKGENLREFWGIILQDELNQLREIGWREALKIFKELKDGTN